MHFFALLMSTASLLWAAESGSPFVRVPSSALPNIAAEGSIEDLKTALQRQIDRCLAQDLSARARFGARIATRKEWCVDAGRELLRLARSSTNLEQLRERARERFEWYQTEGRDGKGEVLFTGYHSPTLDASLTATAELAVPLYRWPDDLVRAEVNGKKVWRRKNPDGSLSLYPDRKAIDQEGVLRHRGYELAYTTDWFSAFVLQMEGSGVLRLRQPDGTVSRKFINYAAQNGHPWVPIARALREQGVPEESLSIPGIRKYLAAHPEKLMPTLATDPSYVFFRLADEGPFGVDSVLLSPRHSIAVDLKVFPVGAITFFHTERPEMSGDEVSGWKRFSTLALTQDTGGAIRGPGRVDVYWGEDAYAEQASGRMHQTGALFVALLPLQTGR